MASTGDRGAEEGEDKRQNIRKLEFQYFRDKCIRKLIKKILFFLQLYSFLIVFNNNRNPHRFFMEDIRTDGVGSEVQ